jgi:NADH-quinone oxidoreductase subunit C
MTIALSGKEIAKRIEEKFPGTVAESSDKYLLIKNDAIYDIFAFLKETSDLAFNYLNYITAVDYYDYIEVIYQLTSLEYNHTIILKTRCYNRENPTLPSIYNLWQGADFQEREIYDLLGVKFEGHPNMKRIFLWDGFQGYPLRKDYL